jgi:mRNA-degrading endonuclease RelE of RelBE toxin-antitoxin system
VGLGQDPSIGHAHIVLSWVLAMCCDPEDYAGFNHRAGAKMLTGMHGVLRIRVAGDYRVLYTVDDDRLVILVVDAGHRRQIYR